jgi:hypothetical protein
LAYIGNIPAEKYSAFQKQDFTTSATTSYTLDNPVANANELALFINNVRQEPTTAYSANSNTLTLTEATSSSDDMYCVYLGKAVQTVNPPNNSVNEAQLNYPLTTFSSTGIDDNATSTAVTIDSNQNVGIGNTVASTINSANGTGNLVVGSGSGTEGITIYSGNTDEGTLQFADDSTGAGTYVGQINYNHSNNMMSFGTNGSESMRIDSDGNISAFRLSLNITDGSNTSSVVRYDRNSSLNNDGDVRFVIFASGNVQNSNNSYAGISDVKLKENIVDATPKLEKLKQVQVRSYNFKDEPDFKQIGVVAQELETVFPNMVEDIPDTDKKGNELGTSTKSVKYSVFVPILIKALQEQQTQIEELKTRITELENK